MADSLFDLSSRVALITGGGGGLGSLVARTLASAGARVALLARTEEACERAARSIREDGGEAIAYTGDVTDPEQIGKVVGQVAREMGPIDILVNNAGVTSPKSFLDLDIETWDRIMDVSAKGAFICTRAVVPSMMERRSGTIINMGSILSERGLGNRSAYCAAKAALANLTRAAAVEFGPYGITVNALGPTVIVTDLNRELVRAQPELYQAIIDRTPLGRLGELDDLKGAILFLASPASAFVSGQILHVDGGYTAS
ncbi:MAG: SDR family NAD(P)-dependent oxidoreductase [Rhizobiaceae bacterium]|jgi:NAD(P)-dependent dehydrogenase (short-subunit alcohol dehydrogenase family)